MDAQVLLGWDSSGTSHDAVGDAVKSIRLFNLYTALQADPAAWQKAQVRGLATGQLFCRVFDDVIAHVRKLQAAVGLT